MSPLHILYPALKSILVNRLQKALDYFSEIQPSVKLTSCSTIHLPNEGSGKTRVDIPVKRVYTETQIWYVSAIALKLAASSQQSAMAIANRIAFLLTQDPLTANPKLLPAFVSDQAVFDQAFDQATALIWQHFRVEIKPPGWIHLRLDEVGLADWLQLLIDRGVAWSDRSSEQEQPHLAYIQPLEASQVEALQANQRLPFTVLHHYARCCSLLRQGCQLGFVQLKPHPLPAAMPPQIIHPNPLTWLALLQAGSTFAPPQSMATWQLIAQLVDISDALATINTSPTATETAEALKYALCLSQTFQKFYAACQIYGTGINAPPLTQAYLGLTSITQTVLHLLLQDFLGVVPPSEL